MSAQRVRDIPVLSDLPQLYLDRAVHGADGLMDLIDRLVESANRQGPGYAVARIDVFRRTGTEVLVEVHPYRSQLGLFVPTWEIAHVCPECGAPFRKAGDHPVNGCTIGVVDNVLRQ